jgi:hypothetical protein
MCAAPKQGQNLPAGVDTEKETVLTGQVLDTDGNPVAGAFCSTEPASSPPKLLPAVPATSASSPPPEPGRCVRCRPPATATSS